MDRWIHNRRVLPCGIHNQLVLYTAMYRIYLLMFLILVGCSHQAGSLVLTSSPLAATNGELYTLICSSNSSTMNPGSIREWHIHDYVVFTTTQGSHSLSKSNTDAFNTYLLDRVNVSCEATQHNVTLRINSTVDNGSVWSCTDNQASHTSNPMTIYVNVSPTSIHPTATSPTTPTTSSSKNNNNKNNNNKTTTTNNNNGEPTTSGSTTSRTINNTTTTNNNNNNTTNNNGKPTTSGSTTPITINKGNPITTSEPADQTNTIAIAAGAAGGGVVVIAVVIVAAICIRKRRRSLEEDARDKSRRDRNPSRSAEMLIESGVTEGDEKVMMENIIYTSSSDVVPAEYSIQDRDQADKVMQDNILYTSSSDIDPAVYSIEDQNHVGKDVYTQVKTNADHHEVTDVYAKPHKGRQETPNGDVYAKVNKVKSSEGTSESIEDMYAKPQKGKRNLRSKTDAE